MSDFLTEDTKAIILLCGTFGKDRLEKPLSLTEYTSLVRWLVAVKMRPRDLLHKETISDAALASNIEKHRLHSLLGRGVQLGFAVEEWQRNGIWIISRSDDDYPVRYKQHLKVKAPPLLFGVGNRSLLSGGGLAIVGSRNLDQSSEDFAREVAALCARNRMKVISGGARGVDQIAMSTALECSGVVIGILADSLLQKSLERSARRALADGLLLLLSPNHPCAGFSVGTAMGRNKLIYAMSDYGLVVSASHKKGGTWTGAQEELKRQNSRPVFVRTGNDAPQGNRKLLDLGAISWPDSIDCMNLKKQLHDLAVKSSDNRSTYNTGLFQLDGDQEIMSEEKLSPIAESTKIEPTISEAKANKQEAVSSIYQVVLPVILSKLDNPATAEELAESLDVNKTQLNTWLKKVVDDGYAKKLSRPVRYIAVRQTMVR